MTDRDPRAPFSDLFAGGDRTDSSTAWFEQIYEAAAARSARVPWDRGAPHRHLVEWAAKNRVYGDGKRAVVVGCGLGDDAEFVASLGFDVTAFDLAPTAIRMARERFPGSSVHYEVADLFALPAEWHHAFDLVIENQTAQALPAAMRPAAIAAIGALVGPGGRVLVLANRAIEGQTIAGPPWPLTEAEIASFAQDGLAVESIERLSTNGQPRWRAVLHRIG